MARPLTKDEGADAQLTMCALILDALRGDCESSHKLLEIADRRVVSEVTHQMAHIIAGFASAEHGPEYAERGMLQLLTQAAGGQL